MNKIIWNLTIFQIRINHSKDIQFNPNHLFCTHINCSGEIFSNRYLIFGNVTAKNLQANAFDSYFVCVSNIPCKRRRRRRIPFLFIRMEIKKNLLLSLLVGFSLFDFVFHFLCNSLITRYSTVRSRCYMLNVDFELWKICNFLWGTKR